MGLITEEVEVNITPRNIKYYENLKYIMPKEKNEWGKLCVLRGTKILVKVDDLQKGSHIKVDVECDICKEIINMEWRVYKRYVRSNKEYFCNKCSGKIYGFKEHNKQKIKNSKSFKQWCIENDKKDVFERWDYELNKLNPDEVAYGSNKKYYFKCPRGLHESELKNISVFTLSKIENSNSMNCKICNSFAQWGIDNICEEFLNKYWDYNKNNLNPWKINRCSNRPKVWIKCQEKDYHGSYDISPLNFVSNYRCPYCTNKHGKVHKLDSLGNLYPDVLKVWSNKNKNDPYMYSPHSSQKVYWMCPNKKHADFKRSIDSSLRCEFRCPTCNYYKGEKSIEDYLINNNFTHINQKKFNSLRGVGKGLLSYDFYLPNQNLLIEYQGEQHEKYISGFHKTIEDFYKQQEHDKRKREYAQNNNINLLEIWYWDFDNIENILDKYLKRGEFNYALSLG